ncbi:MTH938/NDUFAF3 family protein [Dehalococcoidales bacterium]|nr:MTH938/NDUFAF3 family protein [Dehalococcoidales bacterium]MCL0094717.1 MTH938/NDUFAF3 family protein [Dehalococcoidales bacterium]
MNIIDSYQFGQIIINGKNYTSDVIIFPHRVNGSWWRKSGHQLCLDDIAEVLTDNPEVLIVGTGASGRLRVLPETKQAVEAQGIKLIVETTDQACNTYNQLCQSQRVVAALHLTC